MGSIFTKAEIEEYKQKLLENAYGRKEYLKDKEFFSPANFEFDADHDPDQGILYRTYWILEDLGELPEECK